MDFLVEAQIDITEYEALSQKDQRELLGSLFNVTSLKLIGFEEEVYVSEEVPFTLLCIPDSWNIPTWTLILHIDNHYFLMFLYEICHLFLVYKW